MAGTVAVPGRTIPVTGRHSRQPVAVIGSGMAGLTAAFELRRHGYPVTLFESARGHGMAAHSMALDGGVVDVPLRVMGDGVWTETLSLAAGVGIGTFPVEVNVSCNWLDGKTWFRSARMPLLRWPMVGSWRHAGWRSLRLGMGLFRLARRTGGLGSGDDQVRLDQFASDHARDRLFWRGLILPILSTVCTCDEKHLAAWPAGQLLRLLDDILHSSELLRLRGGSARLAEALAAGTSVHDQTEVTEVRQHESGVEVRNADGKGGLFENVIVATQANQLDFLDGGPFGDERAVLSGIPYADGELVVHRDARFMPRLKRDWTALNFLMDRALERSMFTVWVNAVEPTLADSPPVFQTWNPLFEPDESQVISRIPMQRAVVDHNSAAILDQLAQWHRQPGRRLYYCGSWAWPGVPLLETAVRSARAAVERLTGRRQAANRTAC